MITEPIYNDHASKFIIGKGYWIESLGKESIIILIDDSEYSYSALTLFAGYFFKILWLIL